MTADKKGKWTQESLALVSQGSNNFCMKNLKRYDAK